MHLVQGHTPPAYRKLDLAADKVLVLLATKPEHHHI